MILIFSIIGLLLMVLLAKAAGLQKAAPIIQIILFSIAIALSIASAEVATDWLITDRILGVIWDEGQPIFAYIIFWLEVLIIIGLAIISILKKRSKKPRPRRQARPIEEEN